MIIKCEKKINALILCGGKGSRLGSLGKKIPKTLVEINSHPFLLHILKSLKFKSISSINISGYYKFKLLKKATKNLKKKNLNTYNDGNIDTLKRVKKQLLRSRSTLIVCYGDEVANIDINKLLQNHFLSKKILTITTMKFKSNFGFLSKRKGKYNFVEKPYLGKYNIGYMVFDYNNLKYIQNYSKIENYINKLCKLNLINEYIHKKDHFTFNTVEELFLIKNKIKNI